MSIRAQILCSLGIMFLLICLMSVATWTVTSGQRDDGMVINLAARQRMQVQKIAKEALVYAHLVREGQSADSMADAIRQRLGQFKTVQSLLTKGGEYHEGRAIHVPVPSRETAALLVESTRLAGPFETDVDAVLGKGDGAAASRLLTTSEAVVTAQDKAVGQLQQETESSVGTLLTLQACGLAASILVFLAMLFLLRRNINQPLSRLRAYAAAVAGGNLKAAASGDYPPELAQLRDDLAQMVSALESIMAEARDKGAQAEANAAEASRALELAKEEEAKTADLLSRMHAAAAKAQAVSESVMGESAQLLEQTKQVARGSAQQRDRMTETATSMEEMNSTVLEVAKNAASAATSADEAKGKAMTGAEGVRSAVASIEAIRQRILELRESMTRLGQQADSIGHILSVISDIADQTNLLALNAAIEAARAGDAGRGFAVVADEVRKLAEKTMAATKEVGEAVRSIQSQARENIAAVESAASGIEQSTEAAAESGRFMDEIVGIVETTASQVESIATASEEQSATSEEINRAVEEVNGIAGETAAGMGAATEALSALTELAGELDEVIRQMTGETGSRPAGARPPRQVTTPKRPALPSPRPDAPKKSLSASKTKAAKALPPSPAASATANAPSCSTGSGILVWDDSLVVGIKDIDAQHKILVRMICELHEAMRTGKGKAQVEHIVKGLEDYAVEHFGFEESLMEKYKYPGYLNHRKEHDAFVEKVMAFGEEFRANKTALTTEIMDFLKNWLVGHIKGTDKKYAPFFHDRGVK